MFLRAANALFPVCASIRVSPPILYVVEVLFRESIKKICIDSSTWVAMIRIFLLLPPGISAKTLRQCEITKVLCFAGFQSTGRVWGSSRGFEPLAPGKHLSC
jgi:hypothetical protein